MTSWHAQNHFLPGGLKFNLTSVKNNYNYEKKYFECVLGCIVRNITGRATTPDRTVCLVYYCKLLNICKRFVFPKSVTVDLCIHGFVPVL